MQLVWENAPCRENSLLVLLALADWSNEDGVCWPTMHKLAHKARVDRRSAQRIVRKLEEQGLLKIEEGGGRAHQHRYTIETAALCRPPEKGDFPDVERATLETGKGDIENKKRPERATPASPDPSIREPSVDPPIDPPYRGTDFLSALRAFENSRKNMKKPITPEARRLLYKKLKTWDEQTATEALENSVMNRWQGVFEPKRNGHAESSRPNNGNSAFEFTPQSKIQ